MGTAGHPPDPTAAGDATRMAFRDLWFEVRATLRGARILLRHLSLPALCRVVLAVARAEQQNAPWESLGPPADRAEMTCRSQAGRAIALLDALSPRLGPEAAHAVAEEIVRETAAIHVGVRVPRLRRDRYQALSPKRRQALLERALEHFPSADIGRVDAKANRFRVEVLRCRFRDLTAAIGRPELAQLFCAGDAQCMQRNVADLELERPCTLAAGGPCCDFRFRWVRPPRPAAG